MTGKREKSDLDLQRVEDLKQGFLAFAGEMDSLKLAMERAGVDVLRDVPHQKSMAEGFRKLSVWVSGARGAALNLAVERVFPIATMKVADVGGEYLGPRTESKIARQSKDLAALQDAAKNGGEATEKPRVKKTKGKQ
jgi:hypothetical protein